MRTKIFNTFFKIPFGYNSMSTNYSHVLTTQHTFKFIMLYNSTTITIFRFVFANLLESDDLP